MQKVILIMGILLSILSCRQEKPLPEPDFYDYYPGIATALKNGKEWKAIAGVGLLSPETNHYFLRMDVFNDFLERRESFQIDNFLLTLKQFPVFEVTDHFNRAITQAAFHTLIADGDVLDKSYRVLGDSSFMTVTAYDAATKIIEGEFEVTFIILRKSTSTSLDTLSFKQGYFKVPVGQPGDRD